MLFHLIFVLIIINFQLIFICIFVLFLYRDNPSQIHRLMPWINRDIVCLLRETQHDVTTVLESINSALTIMNILSPAFRRRLQPYLGTKTAHFIHELNNFARSPYDMIGYDRAVQYSPQSNNEEIIIEFTSSDDSSDNEHIDVAGDGMATGSNHHNHHGATATTASTSSSSTRSRSTHSGASINGGIFEYDVIGRHHRVFNSYFNPFTAINLTIHNRLTSASGSGNRSAADIPDDGIWVIDLRGESDMNDTTISTAQATTNSSTYHESVGHNATNTEGDIMISGGSSQPLGSVAENIELTSGSSDECEFVLERKPPHLRTPEMVSLDSASDSDVVFVEESKPLNKTSFSSSEGELNDNLTEHKTQTNRHHNKIAALVEAKKRNQSANLVKSEQHTEVYNMGASTSAALRLSIQNRKDKSRRGEGASSSNRLRRDKYALRNNDQTSRAERPKRRGKRLDSESSHSSTSSSTTISSSSTSTTSSTNSSSCTSSDEEYVASTAQKRNRNELARKRRTIRKTKKRKASTNGNRRTNKRDSRKRKKYNDYSSDEDEDEDDNGHVGKNFALVMAINERQKRQNQKNSTKQTKDYQEEREEQVNDEDESDGENSWRLKAVNEPLRKQQQQQQQQKTKISHKNNERKRRRKTSTTTQTTETQQTTEEKDKRRNDRKRQKYSEEDHKQKEILETNNKPTKFYKSEEEDTSSDESDNINLIQLKTKLTGQDQNKETTTERNNPQETGLEKRETLNTQDCNTNATEATETIHETEIQSHTTVTTSSCSDFLSIPPNTTTTTVTTTSPTTSINDSFNHSPLTTLAIASEMATHNIMDTSWTLTQNDLLNFTDDDDSIQPNNSKHNEHETNNTNTYHNDPQQEQQQQEAQDLPTTSRELQTYHSHSHHHDNDVDHEDDEETLMPSNISPLNHHESSNVFVDGTSMTSTTTTTDTILNEAAEQISSAAVNFYNPQQSFNTADFADENSTNSSSSDSSMSSTTTSISSSSNSSNSSNTQTSFTNYGGSGGGGHS